MLPPAGPSRAERWVAGGRSAAALDLVENLHQLTFDLQIYGLAAEQRDREALQSAGVILVEPSPGPFHFGKALTRFIREHKVERLAYFGGSSAPLIKPTLLRDAFSMLADGKSKLSIVNNLHSTDWCLCNQAKALDTFAERFPTDNPLGWVMANEVGCEVKVFPSSTATMVDIDTPADLLMISKHPDLGTNLREFFLQAPSEVFDPIDGIRNVLRTPAKSLVVIGRSSSTVWNALERRSQVWTRFFVEERGMLASGRQARGEVQSLIGSIVDDWGPAAFVSYLEEIADAVLWDTRVWMANRGFWPSDADRFAADLGWTSEIENRALGDLIKAVRGGSIPILTGGHGVVSGGILALLDSL